MTEAQKCANPLHPLIGYQLRRASAALMACLSRDLEPLGLRPTDASVLLMIHANPRITQSEIGRVLAIQSANMAPIIRAFAKAGMLRRKRVDGRSYGLATTITGADLADKATVVMQRHDDQLTAALPAELRARFASVLSELW